MTRTYMVQASEESRDSEKGCGRPCRSLLSFTIIFSISTLLCQAVREYIVSQITSLEKQFGLSSTRSGLLVASEDIGYVVTILFIGHFCRHGHIPRILGITITILGCTATLSGLCYFFSPGKLPSDDNGENIPSASGVCVSGNASKNVTCEEEGDLTVGVSGNQWVVHFLTAMGIIQGVAQTTRFSLGAPFIEDNATSKPQSTLYNGIVLILNYLGTPIALGLGSVISSLPLDLSETTLFPGHPQWVAAWWLGYLVLGVLTILTVIPLFFYPRVIPHPQEKRSPQQGEVQYHTDLTFKEKVIDLPKSLCRLLKNPVFVMLTCANCLLVLFMAGSMTFDPKYVETQFSVAPSQANYIVGAVGLIVLIVGTLGGTIITSKLKMTNQDCIRFTVIAMAIGMALFLTLLRFGCDNPSVVGIQELGANASLSADCACDASEYFPMCGEDGRNYKSPCFAGCTNKTGVTYSSCGGIPGSEGVAGLCPAECNYLYFYVGVEALSGTLGTLPVVALMMTVMRCVDPRDKAMSMAVTSFAVTVLGFLPAPILYGAVIDSTCQIWSHSCGGNGACAQYDLPLLRIRVKGLDAGFQLAALVLYIVVYLLYRLKVVKNNDGDKADVTAIDALAHT